MTELSPENQNETPQKNRLTKGHSKGYIVFLIIILALAHMLDEYSSLAQTFIKSSILAEFFPENETAGLELLNVLGFLGIAIMLGSLFIKGLQDKYGRKKLFIISAFGMTLGVAIIVISPNFSIYYIGTMVASFFLFNDMQYVYINEETPSNKRAQLFTTAKILGLAAILLIPFIRSLTIIEGEEIWRPIYYFPLIIGIIVIVLSSFFLKETRAYEILKEDRKINPEKYKDEKISLKQSFRDLKKLETWSQVKWLIVCMVIASFFAMSNQAYSDTFLDDVGILHADRNIVFYASILFTGVAYFIHGQLTDRVGRKPAYIANTITVLVLLPVEYFVTLAIPDSVNPTLLLWIAGAAQGLRIGAFWNITDVNRFMLIENVPTRIRGNAQAISGLFMFVGIPFSLVLSQVLLGMLQNGILTNTFQILLIIGIPVNLISLFFVATKLKETVHVDITKIEG